MGCGASKQPAAAAVVPAKPPAAEAGEEPAKATKGRGGGAGVPDAAPSLETAGAAAAAAGAVAGAVGLGTGLVDGGKVLGEVQELGKVCGQALLEVAKTLPFLGPGEQRRGVAVLHGSD